MHSRNPFVDENQFLRGYLEAAVWSSNDPDTETPLDDEYSVEDIDLAWREIAREDCAVFCRNNEFKLKEFGEATDRNAADLGHDFWLTRNGHGAGYFDRYLEADRDNREAAEKLGEELTTACEPYGVVDLFPIGDGSIG